MDNQLLIKIIEDLKQAGLIYNDADFSRKTGIKASFVSEMKAGKKPFTAATRRKIEETFPDFFNPKKVESGDLTLSDLARMLSDHDIRFHEQMERIMDEMGLTKKEKLA